jgi:hypothetical protein
MVGNRRIPGEFKKQRILQNEELRDASKSQASVGWIKTQWTRHMQGIKYFGE